MKTARSILCILCASFMLVGCSYFETAGAGPQVSSGPPETIDVTAAPTSAGAPAGPYSEPIDISEIDGYGHATTQNVQVFSLEEEAPTPAPVVAKIPPKPVEAVVTLRAPEGVQTASYTPDPSVTVYPLEDTEGDWDVKMPEPPARQARAEPPRRTMIDNPKAAEKIDWHQTRAPPVAAAAQPSRDGFLTITGPDNKPMLIYIGKNSSGADEEVLDIASRIMKHYSGAEISIEGTAADPPDPPERTHTPQADPTHRTEPSGLHTSIDRAYSVASGLVARGVSGNSIRVVAYGNAPPKPVNNGFSVISTTRQVDIPPVSRH